MKQKKIILLTVGLLAAATAAAFIFKKNKATKPSTPEKKKTGTVYVGDSKVAGQMGVGFDKFPVINTYGYWF